MSKWFRLIACVLLACIVMPGSIQASAPQVSEAEAFIDAFMARKMKEDHIPGAAVAIVRDGKPQVLKGYGYANLEQKIATDPNRTIFRLGSISKTVTATAVMQLQEAGKIDLHADIKPYIPELDLGGGNKQPITAHELLTHTAGFCESVFAVGRDKSKQVTLAEAIRSHMPAFCRQQGEQVAYSNQGMSLAGYLVERVSNRPYEDYVRDNIFKPLKMVSSSFHLVEADPNLAKSYSYSKGEYTAAPYSYIHHLPAGAMNATAVDMAHYMIAHLQLGSFEGSRILSEKTARLMHATQFTVDKRMPGMAYGFFERYQNGLRLIEHDGGIDNFAAYMYLIPSENTGLFIATNASGGTDAAEQLINEYLKRFYPKQHEIEGKGAVPSLEDLMKLQGYYIPNRAHMKGSLNFTQNLSAIHVKAVADGVLMVGNDRYKAIAPNYFYKESDKGQRLFIDTEHRVLARSAIPTMMYERQNSPLYSPLLHLALFLVLALVYPARLFLAAIGWLIRKMRRKPGGFQWLDALVSLAFIGYFVFIASTVELFINAIPWWAGWAMHLPYLFVFAQVAGIGIMLINKRKVAWLQYVFTAASVAYVAYLYAWDFFQI
ncbi:serine hydrolase domain-containing protein [Paenibacillus sp. MMS18-CY102]|uniref:serine hydrolase domain-containing protein n=1 Tax=Paenibacillus sp. MMS18-CY102 TaxID=2682849 RepID=UPI001365923B|nr:serine hydrolase domain-containing protein [Paenibacillus sp. MMS18-CY102]MWC30936.1 serine hydrolase [Paenibacillus sp. MMS18-CY102]